MFGQAAAQLLRAYRRHQKLECVWGHGRVVVGQEVKVPGTHMGELAHVDVVLTTAEEQSAPSREADNGFSHSQVCGHIHTQSTNTLAYRQILFQVCGVFHTWNRAHPAERPTMVFLTLRCADIFTPRVPTHWLAGKSCFRCAESFTPGTERTQPRGLQWLFSLSGVRTYSHLEYQPIGLQANPVSGVRNLSHLEQSASSREAYS